MLLEQGWLVGARRVPSPHYDCRPDSETLKALKALYILFFLIKLKTLEAI
ncbi:regulates AmpC [Escherichia albertii TW07627]|uniref:Regulates AmpC n=1 Tax=Escherichia albertii (strain TW07627) TaxID=502347 RepID=A0ABC9NHR4_ESCAT|nr:regulates AmpC [Escherichia albertii TW07627]